MIAGTTLKLENICTKWHYEIIAEEKRGDKLHFSPDVVLLESPTFLFLLLS